MLDQPIGWCMQGQRKIWEGQEEEGGEDLIPTQL